MKSISEFGIKLDGSSQKTCTKCLKTCKNWIKRNPEKYRELMRTKYVPKYNSTHPMTEIQKEHRREVGRLYHHKNREKILPIMRIRTREWYYKIGVKRRYTPKVKYSEYKKAAERKNRVFDFSFEEFVSIFWMKDCFYCGDPVSSVGIDRLDNDIGYTKENSVSCCSMCNWMKRTFPKEVFINQCKKITLNHSLPLT